MKKLSFALVLIFSLFFVVNATNVFAGIEKTKPCDTATDNNCNSGLTCVVTNQNVSKTAGTCQESSGGFIQIQRPRVDGRDIGYSNISNFITNIITIAFIVAIIVVLIMLILGAYEWIVSGGDKEAVGKARNRIINALIGLAVLAVAFALANLGAQILGFPSLTDKITIPTPAP